MKMDKVFELLTFIESFYPNNRTDKQKEVVANFWYEVFEDYDDNIVELAVKHCIRTCNFEPKISNVLEAIKNLYNLENPILPEFDDVWENLVSKLYRLGDDYQKAFDDMPQISKNIIKDPYRLKEFSQMNVDLLHTSIKRDFYSSFKRQKEIIEKKNEYSYALKKLGSGINVC